MVEFGVIEFGDLGVASFVIRMAFLAFLARLNSTMETFLLCQVLANFLMAIGT